MLPVDTQPRFARFTLRTDCARCGAHLPVNGPVPEVGCADCGHHTPVPEDLYVGLFRDFESDFPDYVESGRVVRGDTTWRWTVEASAVPACRRCDAVLSSPEAPCPSCGEHHHLGTVPSGLSHRVKSAALLIGAEDDQSRPQAHTAPVALSCPQCAASLEITADQPRVTTCTFCTSQIHLPDAVWRQLHPPREVIPWTVRFDGEPRTARLARERAAKAERASEERAAHQAERARAAKEKARRDADADARKARLEEGRRAEASRRKRLGNRALILTSMLCALAAFAMVPSVGIYFFPVSLTGVGLSGSAADATRIGLAALGLSAFLLAWVLGHLALAWRSQLSILGTFLPAALVAAMVALPGIGLFAGPAAAFFYLGGGVPKPNTAQHKDFHHPRGATWALALLMPVAGLFFSVVGAQVLGVPLWDIVTSLADD